MSTVEVYKLSPLPADKEFLPVAVVITCHSQDDWDAVRRIFNANIAVPNTNPEPRRPHIRRIQRQGIDACRDFAASDDRSRGPYSFIMD